MPYNEIDPEPGPLLSAGTGENCDIIPRILLLYVPPGSYLADVTYGKGAFWAKTDLSRHVFLPSDLNGIPPWNNCSIDFRHLPYQDRSIDCVVLDPPYMHGGKTVHSKINDCYRNEATSHEDVIRLYAGGVLEAARVLRKGGIFIVKCQDETESGQRFSHVELMQIMEMFGFKIVDLFVLLNNKAPMMRYDFQKTARKNHSYFLVGKFRR